MWCVSIVLFSLIYLLYWYKSTNTDTHARPAAADAMKAALRPENLEIIIVGDLSHGPAQLAQVLLLYLGTLSGGVPLNHPSAVHWRNATSCPAHASRYSIYLLF